MRKIFLIPLFLLITCSLSYAQFNKKQFGVGYFSTGGFGVGPLGSKQATSGAANTELTFNGIPMSFNSKVLTFLNK